MQACRQDQEKACQLNAMRVIADTSLTAFQEDHACQATLHHFAGQRTAGAGRDGQPRKALEPALAELVENIEQRCVQLEDKADEVTSSLQVCIGLHHACSLAVKSHNCIAA